MKIAILYICTGKYSIFWEGFYKSMEKHFLIGHVKEYFVFTDQKISIINESVHILHQEQLGWPYDVLLRYHIFYDIIEDMRRFDFVFFLNANMYCVVNITEEILPFEEGLMAVIHPGFYNKEPKDFTYERNSNSLAFIPQHAGKHYYMGGFSGGQSEEYIQLINILTERIEKDLQNGIIAIWHEESHLNHYLLDKPLKILDPSYGYAEDWQLPFEKKILILDKNRFGGHEFLRLKDLSKIKKLFDFD